LDYRSHAVTISQIAGAHNTAGVDGWQISSKTCACANNSENVHRSIGFVSLFQQSFHDAKYIIHIIDLIAK